LELGLRERCQFAVIAFSMTTTTMTAPKTTLQLLLQLLTARTGRRLTAPIIT